MLLRTFLLTLWLALTQTIGYAGSEGFPFVGEVINEKVNVRAGQSANFEKLCQIPKGGEVLVVGKEYSWLKVRLPKEASCYIIDKYVQRVNNTTGVVTADRVNIRAGQDSNTSSLGQVSKGTSVKILELKNGWYKIEPLPESYGWVAEQFVKFKSKDISSYQPQAIAITASAVDVNKQQLTGSVIVPKKTVTTVGFLEPLANPVSNTIRYRVVVDGQPAYLVNSSTQSLDSLNYYKVAVEGTSDQPSSPQGILPILTITKIQLIL